MKKLLLSDGSEGLYIFHGPEDKILFCNDKLIFFDIINNGLLIWSGICYILGEEIIYDLNESGALKIIGVDEL